MSANSKKPFGGGRIILRETLRRLRLRRSDIWPSADPIGTAAPVEVLPALYHEDHLERVTGVGFGLPLAGEKEKLETRLAAARPPGMVVFEDVIWCGGRLFPAKGNHFLAEGAPLMQAFASRPAHDHVVVTNSRLGLKYFGHWLGDDCAARELPLPDGALVKSLNRPEWSDCAFYETAFGQAWDEEETFYARKLSIVTDTGYSLDKKRRLEVLRARMRQTFPIAENAGGIAYIQRGTKGEPRTMANEAALIDRLLATGVRIVRAETGGETIARAILDAKIIIGVEGSQIRHGAYNLSANGALLVLQPPHRFYNPHHEWARLLGMRYGTVVGHASADGYHIDIDEVMAMLDRLHQVLDKPDGV